MHHHNPSSTTFDNSSADRVIRDFEKSVRITCGGSDNATAQDAMLGESFYREMAGSYAYMIRGDEVWGWGDRVLSKQMALWQVFLLNLDQLTAPRRLLRAEAFGAGMDELRRSQDEALNEVGPAKPNAVKDYFYWRHREARLIQNMRYYARNFLPHYAPFLFGDGIAVVRRLPRSMRVRKRLFLYTMQEMFPDLFMDDTAPTKTTPIKSRFHILYEQKKYKDYLRHVLLDDPPVLWFELFDRPAFERWFEETTAPAGERKAKVERHYGLGRKAYDLMRRSELFLGIAMALGVRTRRLRFPALPPNFLNRLLTLARSLKIAENC
jgi:hypothetical protein